MDIINNYRHTLFFLIIFVTTSIPFLFLNIKGPYFEIYPAIILPAGAGKVNSDHNDYQFNALQLYGLNSSGDSIELNIDSFLYPIPRANLKSIIAQDFFLHDILANIWFGRKLNKQGCESNRFILKEVLFDSKKNLLKINSVLNKKRR
jgi:hypothetical protein